MLPTLIIAVLLPAAPVPKDPKLVKVERRYGKILDPKGGCKFKLDGDKLLVTLPANETRDLFHKADTVPKLTRTVAGDFEVTVRITTDLPVDARPGGTDKRAFLGGGIQLIGKEPGVWTRAGVSTDISDEAAVEFHTFESLPYIAVSPGHGHGYQYSGMTGQSHLLRVTRTGRQLVFESSRDGREWHPMVRGDTLPEGELTVALYAQHSSDKARTVTFSDYNIRALTRRKK